MKCYIWDDNLLDAPDLDPLLQPIYKDQAAIIEALRSPFQVAILIGNTAKENFQIIDMGMSALKNGHVREILWFHLHDLPSCHLLLMFNGVFDKVIRRTFINITADLTIANTKYKGQRVSVEYTDLNNVRKTKQMGMVTVRDTHIV